jgi:large subunit ribosomal protein L14e
MKTLGREAGKYCVVLKKIDKSFVLITGPKLLTGVKRRKCNIEHLEPSSYSLEIKEDEGDEEVISAYEKANLINKLNLKKPSAAELKAEKEKIKEEKPKEKKTKKEKSKKETK